MRYSLLALTLFLAACGRSESDTEEIKAQIDQLRLELAESRKGPSVASEAMEITDKLAEEVARLRKTVAALAAPAKIPAPVGGTVQVGDMVGAVGGTAQNQQDLFWVLSKIEVEGKKRTVLCLYRARPGSKGSFDLKGARLLDYDMQIIEWPRQSPSVREIKKLLDK